MSEHHEPTTLRSLLELTKELAEALQRRHLSVRDENCDYCGKHFPCADLCLGREVYSDAVAALAQVAQMEDALGRAVCHPEDADYLGACITAALSVLVPDSGVTPPQQHTKHA